MSGQELQRYGHIAAAKAKRQVKPSKALSTEIEMGSKSQSTKLAGPLVEEPRLADGWLASGNEEQEQRAASSVSPLSAAFSFNSYQDILLCSANGPIASTFSASDVQRSLAVERLRQRQNEKFISMQKCTQQTTPQSAPTAQRDPQRALSHTSVASVLSASLVSASASTSTFNSKFRVHSRHRSIGKLEEFAAIRPARVAQAPVSNLSFQEPGRAAVLVYTQAGAAAGASSSSAQTKEFQPLAATLQRPIVVANFSNQCHKREGRKQPESNWHDHREQQEVNEEVKVREEKKEKGGEEAANNSCEEKEQETSMSQTLQSIQSLSMQLNQAANSATELSSAPQSPNSAGGQAKDANGGAPGKLSKLVGKKALRVKELLLQNLGKADRTTDELFQMYEENFYKQQSQAVKLQKEFKTYVNSLKDAHEASRSLNRCVQQSTGDYQSARHDLVCENLGQLEHLNEDLMEKLRGQVMTSVNEHLSQFSELREKIAKRRRKLIDYDSSRRLYELMLAQVNKKRLQMQRLQQQQQQQQTPAQGAMRAFRGFTLSGDPAVQSATSQLVDEARLLKLREQHNYCKVMYETINSELYEELPMVHDKKMKHLLMTLQAYFSLEAQFHSNAGKLFATASDVIDELPMTMRSSSANMRRSPSEQHRHHHHLASSSAASTSSSSAAGEDALDGEEYNKARGAAGSGGSSSGMGSSRGDSSLESSSSLADHSADSSSAGAASPEVQTDNGAPLSSQQQASEEEEEEGRVDNEDEDEEDNEQDKGHEVVVSEVLETTRRESHLAKVLSVLPAAQNLQEVARASISEIQRGQEKQEGESQVIGEKFPPPAQAVGERSLSTFVVPPKKGDNDAGACSSRAAIEKVPAEEEGAAGPVEDANSVAGCSGGLVISPEEPGSIVGGTMARCLYKVKTSYKYLAEDVDELCFEADEVLQVLEFDESHMQEEGWLMGVREVNGQRGLFPANFTRPI